MGLMKTQIAGPYLEHLIHVVCGRSEKSAFIATAWVVLVLPVRDPTLKTTMWTINE